MAYQGHPVGVTLGIGALLALVASTLPVAAHSGWDSGPLAPGQTYQVTIFDFGTFRYECAIHPGEVFTVHSVGVADPAFVLDIVITDEAGRAHMDPPHLEARALDVIHWNNTGSETHHIRTLDTHPLPDSTETEDPAEDTPGVGIILLTGLLLVLLGALRRKP